MAKTFRVWKWRSGSVSVSVFHWTRLRSSSVKSLSNVVVHDQNHTSKARDTGKVEGDQRQVRGREVAGKVEDAFMHWDWFNTAAGAASLMSLILGTILGLVSWRISKATDKLITSTSTGTQALIERVTTSTHAVLERMDQRADERQREIIEVIKALRT
jgi:hypothetical protein